MAIGKLISRVERGHSLSREVTGVKASGCPAFALGSQHRTLNPISRCAGSDKHAGLKRPWRWLLHQARIMVLPETRQTTKGGSMPRSGSIEDRRWEIADGRSQMGFLANA